VLLCVEQALSEWQLELLCVEQALSEWQLEQCRVLVALRGSQNPCLAASLLS